jgi:hypothetical protein
MSREPETRRSEREQPTMSTLTTVSPSRTVATGTRTAVTAAGLAGAVACAGVVASWFLLAGTPQSESVRSPISIVACLIAGLAFAILAATLPGLAAETRLPRWSLGLAGLACAFIAVPAWTFGTLIPHLAGQVTAAQYDALGQADLSLLLLYLPAQLLSLVGFITLAVVGWRRRAMSRGACVLLIVAGVAAVIPDFPPVGLLAGVAFAWLARSARADNDG